MKVIVKGIDEIRPYEDNPRKNDSAVEYVANSIRRFGWNQPIVIDREGVIIAGHTRYKAALSLGIEKLPCVIADDLSKDQVNAFRLADNKTAELSSWDYEKLDAEIEQIEGIDLKDFGISIQGFEWEPYSFEDEAYEEPEHEEITCPLCGATDRKSHFKKK